MRLIRQAPPVSAAQLRELIAAVLHEKVKAQHLPHACEALGLAAGTVQEAFGSKRDYVAARIGHLDHDGLAALASRLLAEHWDYHLEEALFRIEDAGRRQLSSVTRRHLCRAFAEMALAGNDDLLEFLRRFVPVDQLRWSPDGSPILSWTLTDAITQHALCNQDWDAGEVLEQIGALRMSQRRLLLLLEAFVHPERRDEEGQRRLVAILNPILDRDGFRLVRGSHVSGYPVYTVRGGVPGGVGQPADETIAEALAAFDEESIHALWRKALDRRSTDPEGAITAARTLLEAVCKHVIDLAGGSFGEKDDLPQLYRTAAKALTLAPDQHTEQIFRAILGSCQNVVESLGTLRNRLSDAHAQGPKPVRPQPRHAELAVNLAGSMATFLIATWHARVGTTPQGRT